jgi:hypothetical protein
VLGTIWGRESEVEQSYLDNYWEFLAYQRRPTENSGGEEKGCVVLYSLIPHMKWDMIGFETNGKNLGIQPQRGMEDEKK